MATVDVANDLATLCRQGQFDDVIAKYYADTIVSVEAFAMPGQPQVQEGIEAIKGKNQWFAENCEVHGLELSGPIVAGDHFAVTMKLDVTTKATGKRELMEEVCVYEVKDGKIVREQFFYAPPEE